MSKGISPSSLQYIALSLLTPPKTPLRERAQDEDIATLADSIKKIGLLHPILVRKVGDKYQVVCGHRRFLACKMAGLEKVKCIVTDDNEESDLEKMLAENIARKDMSPLEEAHFFNEALEKLDHTPHSLAETIGRTTDYVKKRLKILKWPVELQEAVHKKFINMAVGEQLAKITDEDVRMRYLSDCIQRKISAVTVEQWVNMWLASKDYKEQGFTDPRQTPAAKKVADVYIRCETCGKQRVFKFMRSLVVCEDCLALINQFFEEYMREAEIGVSDERTNSNVSAEQSIS
ncbi:MAG TPA: ParB/RepB/Spo0J family partition protein [Candidatus Desulfofervidus auxilii]|uniref:ParB/RepB/Spo0J family partition protein n=1 Tax=Desulfofervidus auxilii TaxID=1621989 RepID=A0A7V0I9P7_DESA2|nr:ParB/RepB/Spo0J family partition protein [Candidatus Desulfofervidus auxilii]